MSLLHDANNNQGTVLISCPFGQGHFPYDIKKNPFANQISKNSGVRRVPFSKKISDTSTVRHLQTDHIRPAVLSAKFDDRCVENLTNCVIKNINFNYLDGTSRRTFPPLSGIY